MLSSGTTAKGTSTNDAITLIANTDSVPLRVFNIVNEGTVKGWVSVDKGETWLYMPAGTDAAPASRTIELRHPIIAVIQAKRVLDGSDMTGLYADAY